MNKFNMYWYGQLLLSCILYLFSPVIYGEYSPLMDNFFTGFWISWFGVELAFLFLVAKQKGGN